MGTSSDRSIATYHDEGRPWNPTLRYVPIRSIPQRVLVWISCATFQNLHREKRTGRLGYALDSGRGFRNGEYGTRWTRFCGNANDRGFHARTRKKIKGNLPSSERPKEDRMDDQLTTFASCKNRSAINISSGVVTLMLVYLPCVTFTGRPRCSTMETSSVTSREWDCT